MQCGPNTRKARNIPANPACTISGSLPGMDLVFEGEAGASLGVAKVPDLLILDEPVAGLDPLARREFLQDLMEAVAEHELSVVKRLGYRQQVTYQPASRFRPFQGYETAVYTALARGETG